MQVIERYKEDPIDYKREKQKAIKKSKENLQFHQQGSSEKGSCAFYNGEGKKEETYKRN